MISIPNGRSEKDPVPADSSESCPNSEQTFDWISERTGCVAFPSPACAIQFAPDDRMPRQITVTIMRQMRQG